MQFPIPYGESLKLKKPSRSNFGDEKDIYTDLTVVPLQFSFSFHSRYWAYKALLQ